MYLRILSNFVYRNLHIRMWTSAMPDIGTDPRYLLREHRGSAPTTPYLNEDVLHHILQYFNTLDLHTLSLM